MFSKTLDYLSSLLSPVPDDLDDEGGNVSSSSSTGVWTGRSAIAGPSNEAAVSRNESTNELHGSLQDARVVGDTVNMGDSFRDEGPSLEHPEPYVSDTPVEPRRHVDLTGQLRGRKKPYPQCGFAQQLFWTVCRILLLMRRHFVSSLCEVLIPLSMLVLTIGLWMAYNDNRYGAASYLSMNAVFEYTELMEQLRSGMCHNADVGVIVGTPACNFSGMADLYCPTGRGVPAGLCYPRVLVPDVVSVGKLFQGNTSVIPTFDDIVALHWCNRDDAYVSRSEEDGSAALTSGGTLYFAPNTDAVIGLIEFLNTTTAFFDMVYGGIFETEELAVEHMKSRTYVDVPTWAIVQIDSDSAAGWDVTIRLNSSSLPDTSVLVDPWYYGGLITNSNTPYLLSGYTTLQKAAYEYFRTYQLGLQEETELVTFVPMPTAAYRSEEFIVHGVTFAPFLLTISFSFIVAQLTRRIVIEKELQIYEALLVMGLNEVVMYTAWAIVYTSALLLLSIVMSIGVKFTYFSGSNFGLVFLLFFLFSLSIISMAFAIAALFSSARLATFAAPLIFLLMNLPHFSFAVARERTRRALLILSPSTMSAGLQAIFRHELTGGVHASNVIDSADSPDLFIVYMFLIADTMIYLILMVYFRLCYYYGDVLFFVTLIRKKWFSTTYASYSFDGRAENGYYEDKDITSSTTVLLTGLRKTFKRHHGRFIAVNNLHWSMREGEISVLLGHNGAGKTTTMNMITGLMRPDGGDCVIYGKSVRDDLTGARHFIGFCPQYNVLWPELTCREHLWYFASIKGLSGAACEEAVQRMLRAVDLRDKENNFASTLSGGQMRKLSLAIAFVGGSPLVLLDEPTAGMDVVARRQTWELLRQMTADHTILLTTHFMDEADLLGDSIGIMSQGRMQCSGSNMFLKSKLGVGYVLTMSVRMHAPRGPLESLVRRYVPDMEDKLSGAGEAAYRLPMHAKSAFPKLLTAVEDASASLGIEAYSLSATTLEDVFMRIAGGSAEEVKPKRVDRKNAGVTKAIWNPQFVSSKTELLMMQAMAMIRKRFTMLIRDIRTSAAILLSPILFTVVTMLLSQPGNRNDIRLALNSSSFGTGTEIPFSQCAEMLSASLVSNGVLLLNWVHATTSDEFSHELLKSYFSHGDSRYIGAACNGTMLDNASYSSLFYNVSAQHSVGMAAAGFFNAEVRRTVPDSPPLRYFAHPFPPSSEEEYMTSARTLASMCVFLLIPLTIHPLTSIRFIMAERQCKAKHLQSICGLNTYIYWMSNFLFDLCLYILKTLLVIVVLLIWNRAEFVGKDSCGATFLVMILYGICSTLMAYGMSFFFSNVNFAQSCMAVINVFLGILFSVGIGLLESYGYSQQTINIVTKILLLLPSCCVGYSFRQLCNAVVAKYYDYGGSPWSMDVVGWPCVYLSIESVFFFAVIVVIVDHPVRKQQLRDLLRRRDVTATEIETHDPDVTAERVAVESSPERAGDLVRVSSLRKEYDDGHVAVRNLTFGVKPGEVFGFLGTNGAGKTTTLSILCQEMYPTSGRVSICGYDILEESERALHCVGYCPQFDACLDLLTVQEHLYLYARVRGITYAAQPRIIEELMYMFDLRPFASTRLESLSGGNRRKLSVAISLLGGPRVVLLDEPSAGMDPVARRGLWTAIESMADNCAVVLTTHHLEEVDALAHRVAIMVDGTLRCIGDKTYLKQKFSSGTEVVVRLRHVEGDEGAALVDAAEAFFQRTFPESRLVDLRSDRLTFEMPTSVKLSAVFTQLEENSECMGFVDYSVSQTSLEQVFLHVSELAVKRAEEDERRRLEKKKRRKLQSIQRSCCCCLCTSTDD